MPVRLVRTAFAIAALATGALTSFAWAANDAQQLSIAAGASPIADDPEPTTAVPISPP